MQHLVVINSNLVLTAVSGSVVGCNVAVMFSKDPQPLST